MIVGVPKETFPGERRVALAPSVIPSLAKAKVEVLIEKGAGVEAGYPDAAYVDKGGKIAPDRAGVFSAADVVVQVLCYGSNDRTGKADVALMKRDQVLMGFLRPLGSREIVQEFRGGSMRELAHALEERLQKPMADSALSAQQVLAVQHVIELKPGQNIPKSDSTDQTRIVRDRLGAV